MKRKMFAMILAVCFVAGCGKVDSLPETQTEAMETTEATEAVFGIDSSMYELFLPEDYDGDGRTEAFAIEGVIGEDGLYSNVTIYFIDKFGIKTTVEGNLYGKYTGTVDTGKYKFIVWEATAGGSGSRSYIFGCNNTSWYEPGISRKYEWFREEKGKFLAETSDFSTGSHDWIIKEFAFVESVLDFIDAEEASHMQEIDIDYLTGYYWAPNSGDGYYEYQFNKDGSYICYDEHGYINEKGRYSLKDNVLVFHEEWGDVFLIYADRQVGEGFEFGDKTDNIFYYLGSGIDYMRNTGVVCDGTRKPKEKSGYEKILDGDFSSVAGTYEYPDGNSFVMSSSGLSDSNMKDGRFVVDDIKKATDGSYIWNVLCYDNGECVDGIVCIVWPIGVEVVAYDGRILDTDTSRIRYWSGQDVVAYEEYIAYKID